VVFTGDGKHYAYGAVLEDDKVVIVIDDKETSEYEKIEWIEFSADGKNLFFVADKKTICKITLKK